MNVNTRKMHSETIYAVGDTATSWEMRKNGYIKAKINQYKINIERRYPFLDFVRAGLDIELVVAIDFTASNKDPTDTTSLHYVHPASSGKLNDYQKAILSVGEILL